MARGTWLPDPEANNQLQKAYASTAGLDLSQSERRSAAHKLVGNSKFTKQSKRSKDGAKDKYLSYPVARTSDEKTGDTLRIKCVEYVPPPEAGFGVGVKGVFKETGTGDKKTVVAATKQDRLAEGMENGQMQLTTDFTDANTRINDPQNTKTKYYIELPIPQEVNDSNSVTWGEDRMNAIELATLSIA